MLSLQVMVSLSICYTKELVHQQLRLWLFQWNSSSVGPDQYHSGTVVELAIFIGYIIVNSTSWIPSLVNWLVFEAFLSEGFITLLYFATKMIQYLMTSFDDLKRQEV